MAVMRMVVGLVAAVALVTTAAGQVLSQPEVDPFDEARIFIEINATDGDAGLHMLADGEDWDRVKVFDPNGGKILDVKVDGPLGEQGLTELFYESAEPSFDDLTLDEFKARFPEGDYRIQAKTLEGGRLESTMTLSHDTPDGPVITSPEEDEEVPAAALVIEWGSVTNVEIAAYEVVVTVEGDPERSYKVEMPADATSLSVPVEFLDPAEDTKVEVVARATNGNQTATEVPFDVI